MLQFFRFVPIAFALLISTTALTAENEGTGAGNSIKGNITYPDAVKLPPNTTLSVLLEDIAIADAAAEVIAGTNFAISGRPPFAYNLDYDPAQITRRGQYRLRVRIEADGELLFINPEYVSPFNRKRKPIAGPIDVPMQLITELPPLPTDNTIPGVFTGTLPCTDCPGIHYTFDIREGNYFYVRAVRAGDKTPPLERFDTLGSWSVSADGKTVIFGGIPEGLMMFKAQDIDNFRQIATDGRAQDKRLNYTIRRQPNAKPLEPRLRLQGMYMVDGDQDILQICPDGRRIKIYPHGEAVPLRKAYLERKLRKGQPVLVNITGSIIDFTQYEQAADKETLVVDGFYGMDGSAHCGPPIHVDTVEDTDWQLSVLDGESIDIDKFPYDLYPSIRLLSEDAVIAGFTGCNRLQGSYKRDAGNIHFDKLATTRRACENVMDVEVRFLKALDTITSLRQQDGMLNLYDGKNQLRMQFVEDQ